MLPSSALDIRSWNQLIAARRSAPHAHTFLLINITSKDRLFLELLPALGRVSAYFSFEQIQTAVAVGKLDIAASSLKVYLNEALRKGVIHDAGRGWYSRLNEPLQFDRQPVQKLVRATKKALPLLDFCVWSTVQFNPWMHHLLARPVAFLYASRDTLESVGDTLLGLGWEVAVNPGKHAVAREVMPDEKMVVLRPTHAKQPLAHNHLAAPEQALVDLLIETEAVGLMDGTEARAVLRAATGSGLIKIADMKRYAEARYLKWNEVWSIN